MAAAHKGEAEKKAKYAAMAKAQQASFIPFAVETYGGLGKSARKLINQITQQLRISSSCYHQKRSGRS